MSFLRLLQLQSCALFLLFPLFFAGFEESYVLDLDSRLVSATMADGRGFGVTYDSSDRVAQGVVGPDTYTYEYGENAYLSAVRGGAADVTFEWDGPLPVRQTTSGAINGALEWTWEDLTLSLATMSINGYAGSADRPAVLELSNPLVSLERARGGKRSGDLYVQRFWGDQ